MNDAYTNYRDGGSYGRPEKCFTRNALNRKFMPRTKKTIEEKIARIIFDNMRDIDGDEADWLYFREELEAAAREIIKRFRITH